MRDFIWFQKEDVDEKYIIEKAKKGDKKATEILIHNHKEYLYKTAFLYVKDENEAIEVCQETVYKVILNIHSLKNPEYFKTWITRILINNINDRNRAKSKFVDRFDKVELIEDVSYENLEEKIDLYNAIDVLDEKFKTPIILQYFQDMSIKEIAEVLESNENTIKTYIRRGKQRLYKILKEGE
ncbi:MAG: sigma-70 family RNA polymerase sigma factor [Peptostreptococcaceae bacterium]